jgi:hypothetical protein
MGSLLYFLMTFAEAGLGVFGIRAAYEQPRYTVVQRLPGEVEIRDYAAREAVETDDTGDGSAAFQRLFRYITGANNGQTKVAMTVPVAQTGARAVGATAANQRVAMTVPVQTGGGVMQFFLPQAVADRGAPAPTDPLVRLVTVPPQLLAVRQFSGIPDGAAVAAQGRLLQDALARAGRQTEGAPMLLTYDPPFTVPFLRRNEVAIRLAGAP